MLILKSIDATDMKATIECNGIPFVMKTEYNLEDRGILFRLDVREDDKDDEDISTETQDPMRPPVRTGEEILRFGLEAIKRSKHIQLGVNGYSTQIVLESRFDWDKETKRRIREHVNMERTLRFKELIIDSGLMCIYKAFKGQGARLKMHDAVVKARYYERARIEFPAKKMHVEYDDRNKKFVAFIQHSYHRRSRNKESRGSACTADKMIKKLEKMFLREFLGMPHKGEIK